MIVIMKSKAAPSEIEQVVKWLEEHNITPHLSQGEERTVIGCIGDVRSIDQSNIEVMSGVAQVIRVAHPFKLASREMNPEGTRVDIGHGVVFGGREIPVIAGPCSVENEPMLLETARFVRQAGGAALRGGAYKPRSSPYSFQGMGTEGLEILAKARAETGLPIVTEVMAPDQVEIVAEYSDVLQIGARNMQNYPLLNEVGRTNKPVILKRALSGTVEEWILCAEYILAQGNTQVMLCERGIRTFETVTRNTLDLNAVAAAKKLTHLPVLADPSHGTGRWDLVVAMSRAAIACGADGLLLEVHPDPARALSDGAQSLKFPVFQELMSAVERVAHAIDRDILKLA